METARKLIETARNLPQTDRTCIQIKTIHSLWAFATVPSSLARFPFSFLQFRAILEQFRAAPSSFEQF
eukprot:2724689-Alexandrium_andersonii.AAC.1